MIRNNKLKVLSLALLLPLYGCSLTDKSQESQEYFETVKVESSQSIVAPADFDFSNSKNFQVNVDVASLKGRRGYFQVCRDFEETASGIEMGYRDCLIRGHLEDGQFLSTIEVPNHFNELAIEARSYDAAEAPFRRIWRREVDGDKLKL